MMRTKCKDTKKFLAVIFISAAMMMQSVSICHAGSVPEDLLSEDGSQVYFGEVKSVDDNYITVIQMKNIKGDFLEGRELTYKIFLYEEDLPKAGEVYLCGFFDDNNPLYRWSVTTLDTKTLEIKESDSMSERMQEYLNNGEFEKKEAERLMKIRLNSLFQKLSDTLKSKNTPSF